MREGGKVCDDADCPASDEIEQGRDDMKHNITCLLLRGEYFFSPINAKLEEGAKVLDLGKWYRTVPLFIRVDKVEIRCP